MRKEKRRENMRENMREKRGTTHKEKEKEKNKKTILPQEPQQNPPYGGPKTCARAVRP